MNRFTRLRLFIRDYCDEFPVAWSLARMRDCERNGGHRWGEPELYLGHGPLARECSRCGTSQTVHPTAGTGTSTQTVTVDLRPNTHSC